MHKDDEIRLRHMLDAAREARLFIQGQSRRDLDLSRMLVLALVKDIEIVGEAAARISEDGGLSMCFPMRRQRHIFLHVWYCDGRKRKRAMFPS